MRIGQTSAVYFVANVGTSLAGFAATVYFAQNLDNAVLGTYFLAVAVLIWLTVVFGRTFQSAVTKRLSETDDGGYVSAGVVIQAVVLAVLTAVLLASRNWINNYLGEPITTAIVALLYVSVAFSFAAAVLQGERRTHLSALLYPVDRGLRSVLQIGSVFFGFGLLGLLGGYAVAGVVATVVGVGFVSTGLRRPTREHVRRVLSFARYSWLGNISTRAFASMDTVVLGLFVTNQFIAFYEIAWNLASVLALFSIAISQTLFPEFSQLAEEGRLDQVESLVEDSLAFTGVFLVPGLVGGLIVGDIVLGIYGPAFAKAYGILLLLVAARLVYAYGEQLTTALNGIDRPDLTFRVNAAFIGLNVSLNLVLVYLFGWYGAAVATGLSAVVMLAVGYRYLSRQMTVTVPTAEIVRQWLAAGAMGAVVLLGRAALGGHWTVGVGLVAVGALVYFAALYVSSSRFRSVVRANLPVA